MRICKLQAAVRIQSASFVHFIISPIEEVEEDIKELSVYSMGDFNRIFLQGADPFIAPYDYLMKVADMIHKYLPNVKTIGGYARVDNLRNKTVEQLKKLAQQGYSNFYFGNETGDDYLLERIRVIKLKML